MTSIDYRYHTVECENIKDAGYGENENIDFNLNFPNRALVCGSVRFEAEVEIYPTGIANGLGNAGIQRIAVDHMIGAHAFVSSCVTSFQNQGIIENATELPRYAKMVTCGTATDQDMNDGKYVCELRSCDKIIQERVLMPRVPSDYGGGGTGDGDANHNGTGFMDPAQALVTSNILSLTRNPDFSIKPVIGLNNVLSAATTINYSTSGEIKLSFNLSRNLEALYGADVVSSTVYLLKNVEVCYTSIPEQATQAPVSLKTSLCLKSNMNSRLSNHSARVPAICDSVSVSFIRLNREVSQFFNNTALEKPTNISNAKYMFNDSTSSYVTYELKNQTEILHYGARALATGSHNNIRSDLLSSNDSFIAGLDFGEVLDLRNQKFNLQFDTEISAADPFLVFQYYSSIISV